MQANQIDYRAKAAAENGTPTNGVHSNGNGEQQQKSNGHQNGHHHHQQTNGHSEGHEEKENVNKKKSKPNLQGSKSESTLLNNFHEAVSKKNGQNKSFSGRRNKLPWVKDDTDDSGEEKMSSNPMCDIVGVKHLPAASYVTIHSSDSDDSLANTTDDSDMNEEMNSSINYDHAHQHSSSGDSLTDKSTASTSDLIEAHLADKSPKNEREVRSLDFY